MDEFANVSLPDDFEKILSTMRSRNVSVSIIFYDYNAALLPQIILTVSMGAIVFLKHTDNIKRLVAGNENRIGGKKNG